MSRKKRDGESSLELLLDTMCNTFGGVMFIAIALVVIMTMLGKAEKKLDPEAERAGLREELEELKQELKRNSDRNRELEMLRKRLQNDPRREWIARLLQLERQLAKERILLQAVQDQKKLTERSCAAAEQKLQTEQQRHAALLQERRTRLEEEEKLKRELAAIRQETQNISAAAMTFRVMERSDLAPYYFIVEKDRLYRVGPERLKGPGAMQPHPDCRFESGIVEGKRVFDCKPASAGTPLVENGTISAAAIALLKTVPSDRAPLFSIDKASLKSFCLLREYLKSNRIVHGVNTRYETNRSVIYFITDRAEYEY